MRIVKVNTGAATVPDLRRRLRVMLPIVLGTVALDAWAKYLARSRLVGSGSQRALGGWLHLRATFNTGGTLGLGASLSPSARVLTFELGAVILIAVLIAWALRAPRVTIRQLVGCALVAGGGSANLVDRVFNEGRVTDFIDIGSGALRTGWINLADVSIVAAMGLLLLEALRTRRMT